MLKKILLSLALLNVVVLAPVSAEVIYANQTVADLPVPAVLEVNGFTFEPSTGKLFNSNKVEQGFTFEFVRVAGQFDPRLGGTLVQTMNPLQYATRETAEKMLKFVKSFAPADADVQPYSMAPYGPFSYNAPQRFVMVYGQPFNAGLIATEILLRGEDAAKASLLLEIKKAKKD